MGDERALDLAQGADAEMDGQRRLRAGEVLERFGLGHGGRLLRHAGEDERLCHAGDGQFLAECGGSGDIGGHAGDNLVGDRIGAQAPDLFGDGAIERGVAGMHARHVLPARMGGDDLGMGFVQRHCGSVEHLCPFRCPGDHCGGYERAGIEADRAARDEPRALECQELGVPGPRTDEIDGHVATSSPGAGRGSPAKALAA